VGTTTTIKLSDEEITAFRAESLSAREPLFLGEELRIKTRALGFTEKSVPEDASSLTDPKGK
jgi:hypothetical protein